MPEQTVSNSRFLREIFGDQWERALVVTVRDINAHEQHQWTARPARNAVLPERANNYFSISLFRGDRRKIDRFEALYAIVIDDVGKKIQVADLRGMPEPTWILETSPGNWQYGYALDQPLTDPRVYSAIVAACARLTPDGSDPGMAGVNRVMRLPVGVNNKACYHADTGFDYVPHRLRLWREGAKTSIESLAQALGADISEAALAAWRDTNYAVLTDDEIQSDEILKLFASRGEVLGTRNDSFFYPVICPWSSEHTQDGREATGAAYKPKHGFKCHHGSCATRGYEDVVAWAVETFEPEQRARFAGVDLFDALPEQAAPSAASAPRAYSPTIYTPRDAASIPPRQWLYGTHYCREYVSTTFATGGVGKSSLKIVEAMAMASGQPLLGVEVRRPLRVWYWCGEDPREEIERRAAAAMMRHGLTAEDLGGRLFFDSGRDAGAQIVMGVQQMGAAKIVDPCRLGLAAAIREREIDVLIVDPFVSAHKVTENDNNAIDAVGKAFAWVTTAAGCAIELVHHTRKTNGAEATVSDGRGAQALHDLSRSVHVLNKMSAREAVRAGIREDVRWRYVRIDDGKASMAPPHAATWFQLDTMGLDNARGDYDEDRVGVACPWEWPEVEAVALTPAQQIEVQERVRRAGPAGCRENPRANAWVGRIVADVMGVDVGDEAARVAVSDVTAQLLRTRILVVVERRVDGREVRCVEVGDDVVDVE